MYITFVQKKLKLHYLIRFIRWSSNSELHVSSYSCSQTIMRICKEKLKLDCVIRYVSLKIP